MNGSLKLAGLAVLALVLGGSAASGLTRKRARQPPQRLSETGLYSDVRQHVVSPKHLEYAPQYPLWTDGATKRRWFSLPPGKSIDGSRPEAWVFPVGTRFWKEFSFQGRRIETRYLERRADGSWLYAAYAWKPDESDAVLVPEGGQPGAFELAEGRWHTIPGITDCKSCHQGQRVEVLGFSALQLSADRDPNAVHAETPPAPGVDLPWLVQRGLLKRFPQALLDTPPRISAATPTARAALGYLHGNCGHCHNDDGVLQGLEFALRRAAASDSHELAKDLSTIVGRRVLARAMGQAKESVLRVDPGHPDTSVILERMRSRYLALQMPPLGTVIVDERAVSLLSSWITETTSPIEAQETSDSRPGSTQ